MTGVQTCALPISLAFKAESKLSGSNNSPTVTGLAGFAELVPGFDEDLTPSRTLHINGVVNCYV